MISKQKPTPGVHLQKNKHTKQLTVHQLITLAKMNTVSGPCIAQLWWQTVMQTSSQSPGLITTETAFFGICEVCSFHILKALLTSSTLLN